MAFHLHLINPLQDFIPPAAPHFRETVSRCRLLDVQPYLYWDRGETGRLHACWTQD